MAMLHDLPHAEKKTVTEESLRQLMEQDYMLQKGTQIHWEGFVSKFEELVNDTGINHETASKMMNFLVHCISDTRETEQRTARFKQGVEAWIEEGSDEKEKARRKSKANAMSIMSQHKINKADSKEKMAEIIASWDYSENFEDVDKWDWEGTGAPEPDQEPKSVSVNEMPEEIKQMLLSTGLPPELLKDANVDIEVIRLEKDKDGNLQPHPSSLEEFNKLKKKIEGSEPKTEAREDGKPTLEELLGRLMGKKPENE